MNKKQLYHIAEQMYNLELITRDENASEEEKLKAIKDMTALTSRIASIGKGMQGFTILMEIDEILQKKFDINKN